ncbi:MAG: magnesium Mg(2+) and cobalt Co(2+) transport protein CorA, partial [Firmicutes bacterium]|nr:magnesium Mg(2+) and cobalt Co(2+) transport protein CorA [Bacillota bacterium]
MIRTFGLKKDLDAYINFNLDSVSSHDLEWYWVDFDNPSETEIDLLRK